MEILEQSTGRERGNNKKHHPAEGEKRFEDGGAGGAERRSRRCREPVKGESVMKRLHSSPAAPRSCELTLRSSADGQELNTPSPTETRLGTIAPHFSS
ncbi:hypothetical protein EYF80_059500 [Liparis tanakae]|uniref:Uncharacterized protein n=1 Tax=Liparis tanakae TaxID=230148 RepID=A0A4Z2ENI2_9TELE|nr:hypothetical protein EYF80_059500 [Liparis tanakae]